MRVGLPCPIVDPVQGLFNPCARQARFIATEDEARPARAIGRFEQAERERR